jgi:hypothetical protein
MAQLNKGPWQVFDADWFKSHQSSLLSWLNGSWLKRKLSRHAFRIEATEPITEIAPSHYVVKLSETQRRADFRTHPKYAKRLYYSLIVYWWFLHFLDWAVLDRFVPQFSFGFDELTVKSADGEGSATCDGYVARIVTAGATLTSVRTGNGTSVSNTTTAGVGVRITCHADTDKYYAIRRAGFTFDTAALGAGATVSDATFSIYSTDTYHANTYDTVDGSINIVHFFPEVDGYFTDPATFATADYNSWGTTIYSTMSYADFVVSNGLKAFSLDAAGIANLNKTGISILGMRVGSDISETGITWKTSADVAVGVRWVDYTGTTSDPRMVITYTPAATTVYKPPAIIVG